MFGRKKQSTGGDPSVTEPADSSATADETASEPDLTAEAAGDDRGGATAGGGATATDAPAGAGDSDGDSTDEAGGADEDQAQDRSDGPFDESEVEGLDELAAESRVLDLGCVLVPVPDGGQVQVELAQNGAVNGVFVTVAGGRVTMSAFAAPKSPGQWRSVIGELAESVRGDGADAVVRTGPWGRELHAVSGNGDVRFIGVDGPRWMLRGVAIGPRGSVGDDADLTAIAREMVSGTVVRRGADPLPVRSALPVTLPEALAQQLAQAQQQRQAQSQQEQQRQAMQKLQGQQQQMSEALQRAADGDSAKTETAQPPRQNPNGSAMQQFRRNNGSGNSGT